MSSPRKVFALIFLESGVLEEITRPTYGKFFDLSAALAVR